jgi:hypothetical protein
MSITIDEKEARMQPPVEPQTTAARTRHRLETRSQILLPMLGGGLLLVGLLVAALLLPLRSQVSLVADLLLTIFVLCPMVLCLFPVYIVLMVLAFGMNKLHDAGARQLERAEKLSHSVATKTITAADSLSRKSIIINSAFAPLNRIWSIFDPPGARQVTDEEKHVK